jgi:hypothetical protein
LVVSGSVRVTGASADARNSATTLAGLCQVVVAVEFDNRVYEVAANGSVLQDFVQR